MKRRMSLAAVVVAVALISACGTPTGAKNQQPHVTGLSCSSSDQAFDYPQLGWGFCYPATWRYRERDAPDTAPPGVDVTLDVVDAVADPADQGKFGFMIVSTYQRGGSANLADWLAANAGAETGLHPISWGNSPAAVIADSGNRYALTTHWVVELELRSGAGNLDLGGALGSRLTSWKFDY